MGSKVLIERILLHRSSREDAGIRALYDEAYSGADYAGGVSAFIEKR